MSTDFPDDFEIDLSTQGGHPGETREEVEGTYANGRRPDRTYVSRTFNRFGVPGNPTRYVWKVFDSESNSEVEVTTDGLEWVVRESPKGRVQIKLLVTQQPGLVGHLWVERITHTARGPRAENVLSLEGEDAIRLVELVRNLDFIPLAGGDSIRVDDALVRQVFSSPEALTQFYMQRPDLFRMLIGSDVEARDVVALARRRTEVDRFRQLLGDDAYFDSEAEKLGGRKEEVWQRYFEENPWILGTGLGGQLYTSWDEERLQQIVAGTSIAHEGKRVDALMRTSGVVRWMTFAEFKHHRTDLLDHKNEYRPGAWRVSAEVAGGVAQAQATVRRAIQDIGEVLRSKAADGSDIPDDMTFLTRPRSFLVVGTLDQLLGEEGGPHLEKIRSFELFRRGLADPEIVTFDELLARAEWVVDTDER